MAVHEAAEVEDEGHDHVKDHGRTDGEEGGINEEEADVRRADAEFFAPPVAHAEGLLFEAGFDVIEEMIHSHWFGAPRRCDVACNVCT